MRRSIKTLFVFILLFLVRVDAFAGMPACTAPPASAVSWFRAEGNGGDALGPNTAVPQNGAGYTTGQVSQGFDLDGVDDIVTIADSTSLAFGSGSFTVEFWLRVDSTNNYSALITKRAEAIPFDGFNFYRDPSGFLGADIKSGGLASITSDAPVTPGQFYHLALVIDRTSNSAKMFVNGILQASQPSLASVGSLTNSEPVRVGRVVNSAANPNPTQALDGTIDELTFYNAALTTGQVQGIYNAGIAGKCTLCTPAPAGLVAWYPAEGNAADLRGGNNGALNNGVIFAPGMVGQAFSFDGSDDYISIPKSPALNFGTGDFSVEYWVKFNNTGLGGMASGDNFGAAGDYNGWLFNNDFGSNGIGWLTRKASIGTFHARIPASNFSTGTWYHMTGVRTGRTLNFYVNGVLAASGTETSAIDVSNSYEIRIGSLSQGGTQNFPGLIDELAIYNRALSASEVGALAGLEKCKPTAVTPPSGQTAWWPGDGDATDLTGNGNNGTLQNGASFAVSKVGQGFSFDGMNSVVMIPDSPSLDLITKGSIETWLYLNSTLEGTVLGKGRIDTNQASYTLVVHQGNLRADLYQGDGGATSYKTIQTAVAPLEDRWTHVAITWDGSNFRMYIDGTLTASSTYSFTRQDTSFPVTFGKAYPSAASFKGRLDEVSFYNRALTQAEISAIYNAGLAGKLKTTGTPAGLVGKSPGKNSLVPEVVNTTVGDVTVTFASVTTPGTTQQIPLNIANFPSLPAGATSLGLTYDVSTAAIYSGGVDLCFNVPSLIATAATNLRVYHLESGVWINRTAPGATHSVLCTTGVSSLSPFAIANAAPTAASVSVSGRVIASSGRGIANAIVRLTDPSGNTRTVQTGSFGYYSLDNVEAGRNYILSVSAKRFRFGEATRVVFVADEITGLDFVSTE